MSQALKVVAVVGALGLASSAFADGFDIQFNVAGIPSHDGLNAPGNALIDFDVAAAAGFASGTPMTMNGIGWDVTIFADVNVGTFGGSWLQEASVNFAATGSAPALTLAPGAGVGHSGTETFSSLMVFKLVQVGAQDIFLPDGVLHMQFYETFDDAAGVDDGRWLSGALTIQVTAPAPGSLALMGLGGLVAFRRSRA